MAYQAKSISGAQRRVRELEKLRSQLTALLENHATRLKEADGKLKSLAKLAAKGPCFFNPLEAFSAEHLRDEILASMGLNPDGTFMTKGK